MLMNDAFITLKKQKFLNKFEKFYYNDVFALRRLRLNFKFIRLFLMFFFFFIIICHRYRCITVSFLFYITYYQFEEI